MLIKIEIVTQSVGCQVEKIREDDLANQPVFHMDGIKVIHCYPMGGELTKIAKKASPILKCGHFLKYF